MQVRKLTVQNVKSFRQATTLALHPQFNIIVGPNAGGKSNLLDILTVVLRHFLIKSYVVNEGSDATGRFLNLNVRQTFPDVTRVLDKYIGDEDHNAQIRIIVTPTSVDRENMVAIQTHKTALERALRSYRSRPVEDLSWADAWDPKAFPDSIELEFVIQNNVLETPAADSPNGLFWDYLQHLELVLILAQDCYPPPPLHPPYLFFSPYRSASSSDLEANLSVDNQLELVVSYYGATTVVLTSLIKIATLRLAAKRRALERDASDAGYIGSWSSDPEVVEIQSYLRLLDYEWDLSLLDSAKNIYRIVLKREGRQFNIGQASSGEKEILNFILGIFAFGLRDGLVVIDEPELHLHPRWQRLLRTLLLQLAQRTGNQIVVTTHSGVFIDAETVRYLHRVHRSGDSGSHITSLKGPAGDISGLVHIINSHNNEKLFFADRVILVEGVTDRLVVERLVEHYRAALQLGHIVEVLAVHGKSNFARYHRVSPAS